VAWAREPPGRACPDLARDFTDVARILNGGTAVADAALLRALTLEGEQGARVDSDCAAQFMIPGHETVA
jgi:hypothetical protein